MARFSTDRMSSATSAEERNRSFSAQARPTLEPPFSKARLAAGTGRRSTPQVISWRSIHNRPQPSMPRQAALSSRALMVADTGEPSRQRVRTHSPRLLWRLAQKANVSDFDIATGHDWVDPQSIYSEFRRRQDDVV